MCAFVFFRLINMSIKHQKITNKAYRSPWELKLTPKIIYQNLKNLEIIIIIKLNIKIKHPDIWEAGTS